MKKETLVQVFSGEFYGSSKNKLFYRTPQMAASEFSERKNPDACNKRFKTFKTGNFCIL